MPPAQWTTTRFSNGCVATGFDYFEGSRQAARLFFGYSVVISAPSQGLTQTVTQTRKSRWIQADTVDVPLSRKCAKASESVAAQRFPALIVSSHAGGHWFESSSLHQIPPHLGWDFSFGRTPQTVDTARFSSLHANSFDATLQQVGTNFLVSYL